MLGSFRLLLALMVAVNHLWNPLANLIGSHALTTFYMISGFLITKIINEVYTGKSGMLYFCINRSIRIYSCYFFVLILTLSGLLIFPDAFQRAYSTVYFPPDAGSWMANISLFFLYKSDAILVPPAWTLGIELTFYILLMLVARYPRVIAFWFFASLMWHVYLVFNDASFGARYTPPSAASLFFSTGSFLYWFKNKIPSVKIHKNTALFLLGCFLSLSPILYYSGVDFTVWGYYPASFIGALFLLMIVREEDKRLFKTPERDKFYGDLAYPIYLFHFLAVSLVNLVSFGYFGVGSTVHFIISLPLTVFLAVCYVRYVDPEIERMRGKIRDSARLSQ